MDEEEEVEDEEEEDEEETIARKKRAIQKMDTFLSDVADDMLSKKEFAALEKHVHYELRKVGVTLSTLTAYTEGFFFGTKANQMASDQLPPLMAGLKRMVTVEKKRIKEKADKAMGHG